MKIGVDQMQAEEINKALQELEDRIECQPIASVRTLLEIIRAQQEQISYLQLCVEALAYPDKLSDIAGD